jgi:hypothetical protein
MHHRRFASPSVGARRFRALAVIAPLAVAALLGGCPGPEPQTIGSGGATSAASGTDATTSTGVIVDGGATGGNGGSVAAGGAGGGGGGSCIGGLLCKGTCVTDLTTIDHCGGCAPCPTNNVSMAQCNGGMCLLNCNPGWVNLSTNPAKPNCDTQVKRVFVTKYGVQGFPAVGGTAADADTNCNTLASSLGGTWFAWISAHGKPVANRLPTNPPTAYFRLDGLIATTAKALAQGLPLANPINVAQDMSVLSPSDSENVWTGSTETGQPTMSDCGGWSSNATILGTVGSYSATATPTWTNLMMVACNVTQRLYCFEH